MTVVVDASLALKWVLPEQGAEDALLLRGHWQVSSETVVAPPIFKPEVTNAIHQYVRRGHLDRSDAADILGILVPLVEIAEPTGLYGRALELAAYLSLGSTYDALYLALAESQGCAFWTADRRLVRSVRERVPQVHWLGEQP